MPEILTLVVVALLALLVGAVGVSAFRISEYQRSREFRVKEQDAALPSAILSILTAVPGMAIMVDADNGLLRADATAYAKGLVSGAGLARKDLVDLADEARRTGTTRTVDLRLPRSTIAGAGMLDVRVRAAPLPAGSVLLLAEDRTQQVRSQATRRDFTANVSHELKTPIGAIGLLSETIAHDPDDAEVVRRFAPRLVVESRRLSALVQDIIDLSRLEAPDALAEPALVDVDAVVAEAVDRQETAAEGSRVRIDAPAEPSGATVWGSGDQLVTAVRNLLGNAVRYSEPGSRVAVGVSVEDHLVSIRVVDSGIGIPPADQDRVFERFYRVDTARSRDTGGTGLGLSIVKHIAADHGGTVTLWSRLGRGSTFTLVLPEAETGRGRGAAAGAVVMTDNGGKE